MAPGTPYTRGLHAFTLQGWFKTDGATAIGGGATLFEHKDSAGGWCLRADQEARLTLEMAGLEADLPMTKSATSLPASYPADSGWVFFAVSFDASTNEVTFYRGTPTTPVVPVGNDEAMTLDLSSDDVASELVLGRGFDGWMDNFRIFASRRTLEPDDRSGVGYNERFAVLGLDELEELRQMDLGDIYASFEMGDGGAVAEWQSAHDLRSTFGKYLANTTASHTASAPADGSLNFAVTIGRQSPLSVWARINTADSSSNLFWVKMGDETGGSWVEWETAVTDGSWRWEKWRTTDPLEPAEYTFQITYGEAKAKLDHVLITNDEFFEPSEAAASYHIYEAEEKPLPPGSLWSIESEPGASGETYLSVDSSADPDGPVAEGAALSFAFKGAGNFVVWARGQSPLGASSNSFYVRSPGFGGGDWQTADLDESIVDWQWTRWLVTDSLADGSHTLDVTYRDPDARFDRLVVTNDLTYTPDPADRDGDFVLDAVDNCPDDPNPGQEDEDDDDVGDACDIACSDGLDNDGDDFTDYPGDMGCGGPGSATESSECSDGIDNDDDGAIDYAGGYDGEEWKPADGNCLGYPFVDDESLVVCGLGFEIALLLPALMLLRRKSGRRIAE